MPRDIAFSNFCGNPSSAIALRDVGGNMSRDLGGDTSRDVALRDVAETCHVTLRCTIWGQHATWHFVNYASGNISPDVFPSS